MLFLNKTKIAPFLVYKYNHLHSFGKISVYFNYSNVTGKSNLLITLYSVSYQSITFCFNEVSGLWMCIFFTFFAFSLFSYLSFLCNINN